MLEKNRIKCGLFMPIIALPERLWRILKTAQKLKKKLKRLGITYDRIATDDWQSFVSTFTKTEHDIGKKHTVGIEGRADAASESACFQEDMLFFKKTPHPSEGI
jgi:hypothetical protein